MTKKIISIIVWIISLGWLFPMGLSSYCFWIWIKTEAVPVVYGKQPQMNSFPHIFCAEKLFLIGGLWLSVLVIFWSGLLSFKHLFKKSR
jgi:hypothetical protein